MAHALKPSALAPAGNKLVGRMDADGDADVQPAEFVAHFSRAVAPGRRQEALKVVE